MEKHEYLWSEKYRPKTISDCILPKQLKSIFNGFVSDGNITNLLLIGPPGTGKTTVARALCDDLNASYIIINGSLEGNIDTLRNDITTFASTMSFKGKRKYVILDEADYLNPNSMQPALRNFVEEHSLNCFHRSTKIATIEFGSIEIEKIVGKHVTVKCRDGKWRKVLVKSYGIQPLYEYKFGKYNSSKKNYHSSVIATKNHTWFLSNGTKTTSLNLNDKLELPKGFDKSTIDINGVIHGMIFGDGYGHKTYVSNGTTLSLQGKQYATIRLCKQDSLQAEMFDYFIKAGYIPTYPTSTHGDPVFSLGYIPNIKDLPHTNDPNYISGFIYGWWLADGKKDHRKSWKISTIRKDAVEWMENYCSYAGFRFSGLSIRNENEGGFSNAKPLYQITFNDYDIPTVRSINYFGEDEVFCVEEPVTHGFVLANGLLTGNCGFILTGNYENRIIAPLANSRFTKIHFSFPKEEQPVIATDFYKKILNILNQENIEYEPKVIVELIIKYFPDFRKTINHLQTYSKTGKIDVGILSKYSDEILDALIPLLRDKNFKEMREWVGTNTDIDSTTLYRMIYNKLYEFIDPSSIPQTVLLIAKYQYQDAFAADKEINTVAFLTELMVDVTFK